LITIINTNRFKLDKIAQRGAGDYFLKKGYENKLNLTVFAVVLLQVFGIQVSIAVPL
jgi:hypothetical protein